MKANSLLVVFFFCILTTAMFMPLEYAQSHPILSDESINFPTIVRNSGPPFLAILFQSDFLFTLRYLSNRLAVDSLIRGGNV
jgi:hypothetical protein